MMHIVATVSAFHKPSDFHRLHEPGAGKREDSCEARFSTAMRDHFRILIRVSPDAAKDKDEIRRLFNWAEEFKQKLLKKKK